MAKRVDTTTYPFQLGAADLEARMDEMVGVTVGSLSSFYLELPRGNNFLEYEPFRRAFDDLRLATRDFQTLDRVAVQRAVEKNGLVLVVLRCIVGLSPPEMADLAMDITQVEIDQNAARTLDQKARKGESILGKDGSRTAERVNALIETACTAIEEGPKINNPLIVHRLFKEDTVEGLTSVKRCADDGVPYAALLYERMLGSPFITHRNSVSGHVGDIIEDAVITVLNAAKVPYYQSKRAEAIEGFDQTPDFLIPSKEDPKAVIEAKLTQDDGTARDKVTRVQHLDSLSNKGKRFEVIACIDGRGFKIRRQDMKKLLRATRGKVFSVTTMSHLVEQTSLKLFAQR